MKKSILALSILFLVLSCKKDKEEIVFEGVTSRDEQGILIHDDLNDWRIDDTWIAKEESLFSKSYNDNCNNDNDFSIRAYPNPVDDIFFLDTESLDSLSLSIRIVDKDFNILVSKDSPSIQTYAFTLKDIVTSGEIVRVYYKLYGDNCELRGHGDIKMK